VSKCLHFVLASFQTGWEIKGFPHMKDPPSKIRIWPQLTVAGVGTYKSDVGSGKGIHAIRSCSLTHVLQLLLTSSCPRRQHHQFSRCSYFSIFHFVHQNFGCFWFISLCTFSKIFFYIRAGWPNCFPASRIFFSAGEFLERGEFLDQIFLELAPKKTGSAIFLTDEHTAPAFSHLISDNSFREIAGLFRMAPRGQTLTPCT